MFTFHEGSSSKEQDAYKGESDRAVQRPLEGQVLKI